MKLQAGCNLDTRFFHYALSPFALSLSLLTAPRRISYFLRFRFLGLTSHCFVVLSSSRNLPPYATPSTMHTVYRHCLGAKPCTLATKKYSIHVAMATSRTTHFRSALLNGIEKFIKKKKKEIILVDHATCMLNKIGSVLPLSLGDIVNRR